MGHYAEALMTKGVLAKRGSMEQLKVNLYRIEQLFLSNSISRQNFTIFTFLSFNIMNLYKNRYISVVISE